MRKIALISLLVLGMVLLVAGAAYAAHLGNGDRTIPGGYSGNSCATCHAGATYRTMGPHGGYSTSTNKCMACHAIHEAGNASLLPGTTVTAVCQYCHDLTQTAFGPYYLKDATVRSAHRVPGLVLPNGYTKTRNQANAAVVAGAVYNAQLVGTNLIVPGGNATTGGASTLNTTGQGKLSDINFTCNSCHTPHAIAGTTVNRYLGESAVKDNARTASGDGFTQTIFMTDRILKNKPNNVAGAVYDYGSAWCLTCHKGRDNNVVEKHNHPVNETAKAYRFLEAGVAKSNWINGFGVGDLTDRLIWNSSSTPPGTAHMNGDPRSNKQYALEPVNAATGANHPDGNMSYAVVAAEGGPSCQQCHASPRDLTQAFDITHQTTEPYTVLFPNPQRMNFPHVSTNKALLIQENDKFCTSCHGIGNLP